MLTIVTSVMICLPTTALLPTNVPTIGFISLRPDPIRLNQIVLVNAWTSSHAYMYSTLGLDPLDDKRSTSGIPRMYDITVTPPVGDYVFYAVEL